MFILTEMQDNIRVEPRKFGSDMGQEIAKELNKKFANKVSNRRLFTPEYTPIGAGGVYIIRRFLVDGQEQNILFVNALNPRL